MGFFHQLKLLLWKNFTLKKRSPFVVVFELFIPLVLFVILLLIRKKLPADPVKTIQYQAKPLPSSGIVSIMQMFCENGVRDEWGFMNFPNSRSTKSLLSQLQAVADNHHYFDPGFTPEEMDELPEMYRSIIDDPAFLHDSFENATNFQLKSVLTNVNKFKRFLTSNLSLPEDDVTVLLNSTIAIKEIYRFLFGEDLDFLQQSLHRRKRSFQKGFLQMDQAASFMNLKRDSLQDVERALLRSTMRSILAELQPSRSNEVINNIEGKVLERLLTNPRVLEKNNMVDIINILMEVVNKYNTPFIITPKQMAELLKVVMFSPASLHKAACDKNFLRRFLVPPTTQNVSQLEDLQHQLCNLSVHQLNELSAYLKSSVTDKTLIHELHLKAVNLTATTKKVNFFVKKVNRFVQFQTELEVLAKLVSMLPLSAQDMNNSTDTNSNSSHAAGNSSDTDSSKHPPPGGHDPQKHPKGLMKIWSFMQQTVCGTPHRPITNPLDNGDNEDSEREDETVLSSRQARMLGIIFHILYSNPKVLYAPDNTSADDVIQQANATFAFVDLIGKYSKKWLNVSQELQVYLQKPKTAHNLDSIRMMQQALREHKGVFGWMFQIPQLSPFLNKTIPTNTQYIRLLKVIDEAASGWLHMIDGISLNVFQGFPNETAMVDYFLTKAYSENVSVLAGVVFENIGRDGKLPPHVRYKIRQNATFTPTTKFVRSQTWYPGPGYYAYPYYEFGFVWIQDIVERAIIDIQTGRDVVEPGTFIQQFPYPCYMYDHFVFMIEHVMPLCLTISWVYTVAMLVQSIVYEKEQRLKEVMKMMGLSNAVHWCAWFLTTFIQMTITVVTLTAIFKFGKILAHSDPLVVFTMLELYVVAVISFCFLISVLYSKAKVAAACAGIIYFLSYVPYMYIAIKEDIAGDKIPAYAKTLASLFSTTAFGLGSKYFAYYEEMGIGVQWSNISESPVTDDEFTLFMVALMLIFDTFLYLLLVWYIEHVFPGSFGLPKPWYFPFMKSYWCGGSLKHTEDCPSLLDLCRRGNHAYMSLSQEDEACSMGPQDPDHARKFEPEPVHIPLGVGIENLTKVYKTGKKVAVNKLTLNFYEGQITSFLGHNGAGKTTTMSVLTGLIPPSSGYATVYGLDIRTDMDVIRQSLGMCPQHNVLFDKLTVEEHLWFYAMLKGMKPTDIKAEIDRMLVDLALPNKRHSKVDCLSGGMQRKLSVAIAFVGGSRTVILDEPTAGIDPYARRAIWDLLIKYKQDRTIILSTHHMDEADILGDRIAIISNGELKCCGSSIFLKNNIGEGYHLTIVKEETTEENQDSDSSDELKPEHNITHNLVSKCEESKVTEFIQKYVPTAYLKNETQRELQYILPNEEAKKRNFEKLFLAFESGLDDLYVGGYGIVDTNLEEVFLTITESAFQEEANEQAEKQLETFSVQTSNANQEESPSNLLTNQSASSLTNLLRDAEDDSLVADTAASCDTDSDTPLIDLEEINVPHAFSVHSDNLGPIPFMQEGTSGEPRILLEGRGSHMLSPKLLLLNHFRAVIIKRFHYIMRNWRSLFSQIILPAIFVAIAMTVALAAPSLDDLPILELSPSQYYNVTRPRGNFIPFTNARMTADLHSKDAGAEKLIATLFLPAGVGATCVFQSTLNSSYDLDVIKFNEIHGYLELLAKFYEPQCAKVFAPGFHIPQHSPRMKDFGDQNNSFYPLVPSYLTDHFYPSCKCSSDNTGFICSDKHHLMPPSFHVVTQDILLNITGQRTENYLLYTTSEYRRHRYGALAFGLEQHFVPQNFGKNSPTLFRKLAVRSAAKVWFNHKGYHSMPAFLNTINNAILRANLPSEKGNPSIYGITLYNHPWNETNNELANLKTVMEGSDVLIAIFIIVAMSFVPASFVVFLVYEKSTKSKHLQFVTGINPIMYWLGNYVWDMCNYVIPAFMCILILLIFQIPAYVSTTNIPAVVALFLLYGWSIIPVMYPFSFLFNEPSTAYICLIVINLFTGITCIVSSFLLEMFSYDKDLGKIHRVIKYIFMMFPNYCLGRGLMDLAFNEYKNEFFFKTGQYDKMKSPMEWGIIPNKLVAMTTVGLIFFLITLLCEYRFFIKPRKHKTSNTTVQEEDLDVAAERRRVLKGNGRFDLLRLENLTKVYVTRKLGRHLAVDKLCIGVPPGECFGLLGVNGAGKTTTFKMLTGDLLPTSGNAYVDGYSVVQDMQKVQKSIGYCPQFDSLYDELTAREHLQFYCRVRGVTPKDEKMVVNWALKKLGLMKYADKLSGTYSGGNKRKLSTAIALIGHPPVIFLDEPTTGMDPHSRRFLWDLILGLIQDGRSVVLTSHSMEECEVLCTRLAIMVNGRFKCLGSIQHLKNKYGDGYTITIRVKGPNYDRDRRSIERFFTRNVPQAVLKEHHYNMMQYELTSNCLSLSAIFTTLEDAGQDLPIEDYSVSQNTLDNVFINFVKQQMEIVQEEAEGEQVTACLSSIQRPNANTTSRSSSSSHLSNSLSEDSLYTSDSDDECILRLDQANGNRLSLMPM
ncbi:ATP-binding cassette sub-family A member 2-like [Gigantopelta aegis]|uniref:ATP-binding cassette sub-family A member 2-like n=1 Tax=Gigantopelta aegis TaxID=1735272 RepID=UPI001B88D42D|nr:ATP-binding cassette sub-family A member 2-like [Gigantopelta aegis]